MPLRGGRADIDDRQRAAGRKPLEAALWRAARGGCGHLAGGQQSVGQRSVAFLRAMEKREPAIAVAVGAEHRRHPLDRLDKRAGQRLAGIVQRRAEVEKLAEYIDMNSRISLDVAAVSQDLAGDLAIQPPQRRR